MTRYTFNNPPDDADYRNPTPNRDPKFANQLENSKSPDYRMWVAEVFYYKSRNQDELVNFVFAFGWDFGWSFAECMEALVDAGFAHFDPIKGAL